MKRITKLQTNKWNGRLFTSASHLNDLFLSKAIRREIISERHGLHWSEYTYRFTTHHGVVLAEVKKYSDHGFSSQAYGVEIPVSSLVDPAKSDIEFSVWQRTARFFRKHPVIASIAFKEFGREAFY